MKKKIKAAVVALTLIFSGEITMANNITLKECPKSPNCVSTQTTQSEKKMNAIEFTQQSAQVKDIIKKIMKEQSRTELVKEEGGYLHYTVTSFLFRFVDDVEFLIDEKSKAIHFRSASQTGHSDLGKNKERMNELSGLIKKRLEK